jgi:hypothetical protein
MAQPAVSRSVNPSDPTTASSGRPVRQDDFNVILRDLQKRVEALEALVAQGGIILSNSTGTVRRRLTVDNSGNLTLTAV